jgi:hypothetical protein
MKKHLFLAIAVTMILIAALFAQAQPPAGQGQAGQGQGVAPGGAAGGARGGMMGGRGGSLNVTSINAAIKTIDEQLATLKKAMEGAETSGFPGAMGGAQGGQRGTGSQGAPMGGGQAGPGGQAGAPGGQAVAPGGQAGAPGGQADAAGGQRGGMDMQAMQAMMEQMQKRNEAVQTAGAAIADQALVLKGTQARTEFQKDIDELQSIADLATKQKAPKIAEFVKGIIDARQKAFQVKATKLGIPAQASPGGMMGGEPPIKGGFEWID